jgi:16S rRNA (adenine1518-N6/adenine1519-N6)-dimethyltransferase
MRHIPKKKFGQNFLIDASIIQSIIQSINPLPDDTLIEIGPGLGALTKPLLEKCPHLLAI